MDNQYAAQYIDLWQRHWWWRARQRIVMAQARRVLEQRDDPTPPTILDIGCAGGVAFDDWSQLGDVYGVEPDPQLAHAIDRWRHRVEHVEFDANYVAPRSYDLVLMLDVLEHLEDDAAALDRVAQLLKPGGHLILSVPALMGLWSHHDVANHHWRRYHRRPLHELLAAHGFSVSSLRYLFGWSIPLLFLRKILLRRPPKSYVVSVPSSPVNGLFYALTRGEESIVQNLPWRLPVGSSLLAVARRPC